MSTNEINFCTIDNDSYPRSLKESMRNQRLLYYKGCIDIINTYKNIAIIGSRKASDEGLKLAYNAGQQAAEMGLNVVNGLALGCDTAAIKGALSVGGRCVAIMPCGLEQIQPKSNQKLADEILKNGGCVLSEYSVGTRIQRYQYVERDRLQSGISQGVLIIEAELQSGTMHTADYARQQFKRLACYSAQILNLPSGNQYLENSRQAHVLFDSTDMLHFLESIRNEPEYEQMKLF